MSCNMVVPRQGWESAEKDLEKCGRHGTGGDEDNFRSQEGLEMSVLSVDRRAERAVAGCRGGDVGVERGSKLGPTTEMVWWWYVVFGRLVLNDDGC